MEKVLSHRTVQKSDFEEICKLPQSAEEFFFMFPKATYPLTVEQLEQAIESRFDSTVVLLNEKVVSFANFYEVKENEYCSIGNVIVDTNFRNQGIGKFLIGVMENIGAEKYRVSEFYLSCFNANTSGFLLYSKLGYKPYDIEKWVSAENKPFALIKLKHEI